MQPTILIVDDEKHTRDGLRRLLEDDYDVYVAEDIGGAISVLERETVELLLTDLRLGGEDGMQLIERALKMPHPPVCIMMTAYASVDTAVEAIKRGAYDLVTKPLDLDKVEMLIARALQSRRMEQENRTLRQQIDERFGLENILGESLARSEEHTSELQSQSNLVCRLLLEKKKKTGKRTSNTPQPPSSRSAVPTSPTTPISRTCTFSHIASLYDNILPTGYRCTCSVRCALA